MSDAKYRALNRALVELEVSMVEQGLWSQQVPSETALASVQPFAVDTLAFEQWLQFIMLPTFQNIIQRQTILPDKCDIHPMAHQLWQDQYLDVQRCLLVVDRVVSNKQ